MISVGSDFSGVGAFDQALMRLGIDYKKVFACDWDKYARQTYIHNYGEPDYFPMDVYDREIPTDPLDIYMTSPPCQAFSLAGKRQGEKDKRGILFYNSHEFIQKNNPRYFIFENVKGLLSDDNGKTFRTWVEYLGGKSINGNSVLFPHTESVPYHIYFRVLNAKNYGIPQNRERVFIVGIRDDVDNDFTWPKEMFLEKRLKDVLEDGVYEKYYLSEKMIQVLSKHGNPIIKNDTPEKSACIHAGYFKMGGIDQQYLKVKSATSKGYEVAEVGEDSINFEQPNSETRRGRVGKGVAQTVTTGCQQGVAEIIQINPSKESGGKQPYQPNRVYCETGLMATLDTDSGRKSVYTKHRIRRLTPRECFRLMDFPDSFLDDVFLGNTIKSQGILLYLNVDKFKKIWNVREKNALEQQLQKGCALCTIKDIKSTETQISFSNIQTGKKEDVKFKGVIELCSQQSFAQTITTQRENSETHFTWIIRERRLERDKSYMEGDGIVVNKKSTELFMKIIMDENLIKASAFITLTVIPIIMKYITCMLSNHKGNIINVMLSYKNLQGNLSQKESFVLKTADILSLSDSQLYKQAGNSICVGVLAAIIGRLRL